jgi:hypothetical protein
MEAILSTFYKKAKLQGMTMDIEIRIAVTFQEGLQGTYSYEAFLFCCPEAIL